MPEIKMYYKTVWLTLNRSCNLSCPWCYARNTQGSSQDMRLDLAYNLIDFISQLGIKSVRLIGGEPSIYPHIIDVIKAIKSHNATSILITNGIQLQNEDFCKLLFESGLTQASISVKGNEDAYATLSKKNQFQACMNALSVLRKFQKQVTATFVITPDNVYSLPELIKSAKSAGATNFGLSFVYEFNCNNKPNQAFKEKNAPRKMIKDFMTIYEDIDIITDGNFSLQNSFPLCLWNKDDYEKLKNKNQINTICQLLSRGGLIFDTDAAVIPCNAMHNVKLLRYGKDFTLPDELYSNLNNKNIQQIYQCLLGAPDETCVNCPQWKNCGGGCVATYTNFSLQEMLKG